MPLVEIDYLAVVVATLAAFVLGALWYSPVLFGRPWMRVQGFSDDQARRLREGAGQAYFVALLCYLVVALIAAVLMSLTGFGSWEKGLLLGFLFWLGFAAPLGLTGNVFSNQGIGVWLIDTGYQLLALLLVGMILGLWRQ